MRYLVLTLLMSLFLGWGLTDQVQAEELPAIKIVLCGDSTVQNYKLPNDKRGWGQVMGEFLSDKVTIVNLAAGGRSTKTFIKEGRLDKALAENADYALIQFGHNDSHKKDRPESTDADGDYKTYLEQYISSFGAKNVKMVFVTPMHRRVFRDGKLVTWLLRYRNAMIEVAKKHDQPLVDLYMHSEVLMEALGEEGSAYLSCNAKDRSHFSPAGAKAMALCILKDLQLQNHPLAAYIKPDVASRLKQATYPNLAPAPEDQ